MICLATNPRISPRIFQTAFGALCLGYAECFSGEQKQEGFKILSIDGWRAPNSIDWGGFLSPGSDWRKTQKHQCRIPRRRMRLTLFESEDIYITFSISSNPFSLPANEIYKSKVQDHIDIQPTLLCTSMFSNPRFTPIPPSSLFSRQFAPCSPARRGAAGWILQPHPTRQEDAIRAQSWFPISLNRSIRFQIQVSKA